MDRYSVGGAWTDETLEDAAPSDIAEWMAQVMRADEILQTKMFMATTLGGDDGGNSRGFWNASTTDWTGSTNKDPDDKPQPWKNNTFLTTHDHYDYSGSTSIALADFTALRNEIMEHGYGVGGQMVCFVSHAGAKLIADLAGWTTAMTANTVVDSIAKLGMTNDTNLLGFKFVIDDWMAYSTYNYLMAFATDAPCVAMRTPKSGGGLKTYSGPFEEFPLKEMYFKRRFGEVVSLRGAGAVRQIAASYTTANTAFTFAR
jgi:hypothetical protein